MHSANICHRDLKAENVMINEQRRSLKIVDFGMSVQTSESSLLTSFCGSPNYASPEQVSRQPYDGRLSDIWSAGVLLFFMTCGILLLIRISSVRRCSSLLDIL